MAAARHVMGRTISAPPTARTGRTPTPSSGRSASIVISVPVMPAASLTSVRRRTSLFGPRMKTRCPSPILSLLSTSRSRRVCSPTGAASIRVPPAQTPATTRHRWTSATASREACRSTPPTPSRRRSLTTKALPTMASPVRVADRAPRPSSTVQRISETSSARGVIVGTQLPSTTFPSGRGRQFGSSMSRLADAFVGGWQLSNIFLWQTGPFESTYFPSGQGDPSGTGSGLNGAAAGFDGGHRNQAPDRNFNVSVKPAGRSRTQLDQSRRIHLPGLFRVDARNPLHHRSRL